MSYRHYIDFLMAMTEREFRARYKKALFGFLWILLNPLLQMGIIGLVFQFFVPFSYDNYFLYLFSGLLPWNFFSFSLTKATPLILHQRNLVTKAKFPREILVFSLIISNIINLLISLLLLLVFIFVKNLLSSSLRLSFINVSQQLILCLLVTGWLALFTTGICLFLAALQVRFRDIQFLVQAGLPLVFYLTPIVYTIDLLPNSILVWLQLNPLAPIIQAFQAILVQTQPPPTYSLGLSLCVTILLFFGGLILFRNQSKYFADLI